jgi:hypothetical protein
MHGDAVLLESISGSIVVASLLDGDDSVFPPSFSFGLELNSSSDHGVMWNRRFSKSVFKSVCSGNMVLVL